jgi:hypothetical protein
MIDYFMRVRCSLCEEEAIVEGLPTDTQAALRSMAWVLVPLHTGAARHFCPACALSCIDALRAERSATRPSYSPVGVA